VSFRVEEAKKRIFKPLLIDFALSPLSSVFVLANNLHYEEENLLYVSLVCLYLKNYLTHFAGVFINNESGSLA
jgi:hypothetical protein